MKSFGWIMVPIFLVFILVGSMGSYAGNGKVVFETKCAKCHGMGGSAGSIAPTKFASVQWQRFFDGNKHARKKDISKDFTPDELALVKEYLMQHAADSDKPEAAGLK